MSDIFGQSLDLSSLGDSTQSSWKRYLQKAKEETDTEKLVLLVHGTELALYHRWQELGTTERQSQECQAMMQAVNDLWEIKIHKLGWPGRVGEL